MRTMPNLAARRKIRRRLGNQMKKAKRPTSQSSQTQVIAILSGALLPLLVCMQHAQACSCCADPGEWRRFNWTLTTGEQVAMEGSKYSGKFRIDITDAVGDPKLQDMVITAQFHDGTFSLWANGVQGHHQLLQLNVPISAEDLQTDTGGSTDSTQVVLYKERTFDCTVQLVDPRLTRYLGAHATLILQGDGNRCFTLDDLQRWIVRFQDISGSQAQPRAYGTIDTSTVPEDWYNRR